MISYKLLSINSTLGIYMLIGSLKVSIKKNKFKISDLENSTVFIYNK